MTERTPLAPWHTVESCGGMLPTQAEGRTHDDRPYYFRARHGRWSLQVGEPGWPTDYVAWPLHSEGDLIAVGDDPSHGCMTNAEVGAVLNAHLGVHWSPDLGESDPETSPPQESA